MVNLIKANPNEVELLLIGPCTNLATAITLEPELPALIKRVWLMGGTSEGKGNQTPAAEFNFHCDPEAAHMVFSAFEQDKSEVAKLVLFPWEQCLQNSVTWDFYD